MTRLLECVCGVGSEGMRVHDAQLEAQQLEDTQSYHQTSMEKQLAVGTAECAGDLEVQWGGGWQYVCLSPHECMADVHNC